MDTRGQRWVEALRQALGDKCFRGDGLYGLGASLECLSSSLVSDGREGHAYQERRGSNFEESI